MTSEALFWKRPKPRPCEQISNIIRPGVGLGSLPDTRGGKQPSRPGGKGGGGSSGGKR